MNTSASLSTNVGPKRIAQKKRPEKFRDVFILFLFQSTFIRVTEFAMIFTVDKINNNANY